MKFHRIGGCVVCVAGALIAAVSLQATAQSSGDAPAVVASAGVSTSGPGKAADRALRKRVLTALGRTKGLRASGVTVRASNGAVTLQGWVPEEPQIERAAEVARSVSGVTTVKNELTLSTF